MISASRMATARLFVAAVSVSFGAAASGESPIAPTTTRQPAAADVRPNLQPGNYQFVTWDSFKSDKVYGAGGADAKEIGTISDVLLARDSGRVNAYLLTTDKTLGMGGKTILVPYSAMRRDASRNGYVIDPTPDAKTYLEFSPEWWRATNVDQAAGKSDASAQRDLATAFAREAALEQLDPFEKDRAKQVGNLRVAGKITQVDRRFMPASGEYVFVTVARAEGGPVTIALGPAWHCLGHNGSPTTGADFAADVMQVGEGDSTRMLALSTTIGGQEMKIRNPDGTPAWSDQGRRTASGIARGRFVLASEVTGKPVECRGEKCGTVEALIVERNSGMIAFLSVDPDQKLVDTDRLVPWSVASVRPDGRVSIDAPKDAVLNSYPTPKNYDELQSPDSLKKVYDAYHVEPIDFRARAELDKPRGAWHHDGDIGKAIRSGKAFSLQGTIESVGHEQFYGEHAVLLTIKTDAGSRQVLVGPMGADEARHLKAGSTLSIDGWEVAAPGGSSKLVAGSIRHGDKTINAYNKDVQPQLPKKP